MIRTNLGRHNSFDAPHQIVFCKSYQGNLLSEIIKAIDDYDNDRSLWRTLIQRVILSQK